MDILSNSDQPCATEKDAIQPIFDNIVNNQEITEANEMSESEQLDSVYTFPEEGAIRKKGKNKSTRKHWSSEKVQELAKFLGANLHALKTPGQAECKAAIQKSKASGGLLQHRHWHVIVKKTSAII